MHKTIHDDRLVPLQFGKRLETRNFTKFRAEVEYDQTGKVEVL